MSANHTGRATRRNRRPLLAATGGATLLLAAGGLAWVQGGAGADPVSTDVAGTCAIAGGNADMTVPMTVDDKVDPVAPGGQETLVVDQGLGQLPVEVTISKVVVTTPIPAEVASTDSVTFEGGNMTGSYEVVDGNLVVTFTGPQSSSQLQFPRTTVNQTIADEPGTDTIHWKVWSSLVADTNYGTATCTPNDPTQDLNTTAISGGGPATTATTTTPGDGGGDGTTTTTAPGSTTTTTAPSGSQGGDSGGTTAPGVSVCVEVSSPAPVPVPLPCPITVPPSDGGSSPLPVPVPAPGGGGLPLPVPLPAPGGSSPLPVPLPAPGADSPLPVPLPAPGTPSIDVTLDGQISVGL